MVRKYVVLCDECLQDIQLPGEQYYTVTVIDKDGLMREELEIHLKCLHLWAEAHKRFPVEMDPHYKVPMTPGTGLL